jgi:hypothetical protein
MGTPYKIDSRTLVPPSLRTGIFIVKCACPEPFRYGVTVVESKEGVAVTARGVEAGSGKARSSRASILVEQPTSRSNL